MCSETGYEFLQDILGEDTHIDIKNCNNDDDLGDDNDNTTTN